MIPLLLALALSQSGLPSRAGGSGGSGMLTRFADGGTGSGTALCQPYEWLWSDGTYYECRATSLGQATWMDQSIVNGTGWISMGSAANGGSVYAPTYSAQSNSFDGADSKRQYHHMSTSAVAGNVAKATNTAMAYPAMEPRMYVRVLCPTTASAVHYFRFWVGWSNANGWSACDACETIAHCGIRWSTHYDATTDGGPRDTVLKLCSGDETLSSCVPFSTGIDAGVPYIFDVSMTATSCTGRVSQDELNWETVTKSSNIPGSVDADTSLILGPWVSLTNIDGGAATMKLSYIASEHR